MRQNLILANKYGSILKTDIKTNDLKTWKN